METLNSNTLNWILFQVVFNPSHNPDAVCTMETLNSNTRFWMLFHAFFKEAHKSDAAVARETLTDTAAVPKLSTHFFTVDQPDCTSDTATDTVAIPKLSTQPFTVSQPDRTSETTICIVVSPAVTKSCNHSFVFSITTPTAACIASHAVNSGARTAGSAAFALSIKSARTDIHPSSCLSSNIADVPLVPPPPPPPPAAESSGFSSLFISSNPRSVRFNSFAAEEALPALDDILSLASPHDVATFLATV